MADDWYEIMELPPGASPEDIEKQYNFLCQVWDPSRFSGGSDKAQAEEKMQRINAAYAVLPDPRRL
jgi:DnaJ-class molecular chaperone